MSPDSYVLAGSDVSIPLLGVGTWAWGDRSTWGMGGYDADLTIGSIEGAWDTSIDAGVTFFDTAEVYGGGESERIIGQMRGRDASRSASVVLATKFHAVALEAERQGALLKSLRASLRRLGVSSIDLYQIHGPISLRSHAALADALAAAREAGLVKAVGVSNYSVKETRSIAAELDKRGLKLATKSDRVLTAATCPRDRRPSGRLRRAGCRPPRLFAIGQGRLTGKYSTDNPPPGKRTFSNHPMEIVDTVVAQLRTIGEKHGGKKPSQVALNWVMAKGAVPIPGAKNSARRRRMPALSGGVSTPTTLPCWTKPP